MVLCLNSHKRAASGSHQAQHREGVYDEAQLFVGQQGVDENEAYCGQQQQPHPPVKEANGDKQQCASQATGQRRVEVPEKGGGLLGRGESRKPDECHHELNFKFKKKIHM